MTIPKCTEHLFPLHNDIKTQQSTKKEEEECDDGWTKVGDVPVRTFKVIVLGDSGVGKTCLTLRLCAGEFPKTTYNTIGVDVKVKRMNVSGENVDLQVI